MKVPGKNTPRLVPRPPWLLFGLGGQAMYHALLPSELSTTGGRTAQAEGGGGASDNFCYPKFRSEISDRHRIERR